MAEEKQQDGQKTLVAFVVGLLIGGMLVWAFSGPSVTAPEEAMDDTTGEEVDSSQTDSADTSENDDSTEAEELVKVPALEVGDGKIVVNDQPASQSITLDSATYPINEGWIGVREYDNENLGFILGVVRFSESSNLVPTEIILQRPTIAGRSYAITIFTEDGDNVFSTATDVQISTLFDTFVAE